MNRLTQHTEDDVVVFSLTKGSERYVFIYTPPQRANLLRRLGRFARDPDLSFTWYDAAVCSQFIRYEAEGDS